MKAPATFLPVEFAVIGGAIAGLTSAITLRQAGHDVVVFEENDDFRDTWLAGGCRVPPNISKLYYRWGMEQRIKQRSASTREVVYSQYDTGEVIPGQEWDEDIMSETGGEYLLMHYAELRLIMYERALELGAKIRSKAKVVDIRLHPQRSAVVLESGEVIEVDVIVGADGVDGLTRKMMIGDGDVHTFIGRNMWNVVIPEDKMRADPTLLSLLDLKIQNWYSKDYGVMGFPLGQQVFSLLAYSHGTPGQDTTKLISTPEKLLEALKDCEPRLAKLAQMASTVVYVPMVDRPVLEEWVHPDGRLIVIGEAAHPQPAGSTYSLGMGSGDAAVLGRLFQHLHRRDQIESFLSAVEDIRQKRLVSVQRASRENVFAMALPVGAQRDDKDDTGTGPKVLAKREEEQKRRMMQELVEDVFAYDAEDEADNWWVQWGILQERAARVVSLDFEVTEQNTQQRTSGWPP